MQSAVIVLGQSLWKQTSSHLWFADEFQIRNAKCTDLELGLQVGQFLKGLFQLALHLPAPTCFLLCFDFTLLTNKWLPSMRPLCKNLDSENHKSIIAHVYYYSISWIYQYLQKAGLQITNNFLILSQFQLQRSHCWYLFLQEEAIQVSVQSVPSPSTFSISNSYAPIWTSKRNYSPILWREEECRVPEVWPALHWHCQAALCNYPPPCTSNLIVKMSIFIYLASTYCDWWKNDESLKNHPPCQSLIWFQAGAQVCSTLFKTSLIKFNLHKKNQTFTVSNEYSTAS